MDLSPRSMAAWWLVGLEDQPDRCGELCVFEVFGDTVTAASTAVGMGVHAFRDPALTEDFAAPLLDLDVSQFHTYAVDWTADRAVFLVDGEPVRTVQVTPAYPMQSMVAVFDFPDRAGPESDGHVPAPGRRPAVDRTRRARPGCATVSRRHTPRAAPGATAPREA